MQSLPSLALELRIRFACDIVHGMAFLHAQRIAFRDLKSSNVLVDGQDRCRLADFGSVRRFQLQESAKHRRNSFLTTIGRTAASDSLHDIMVLEDMTQGAGSLLYMAPEILQATPQFVPASEVWSFGVLAWEIATQQRPDLLAQSPTHRGPGASGLLEMLREGSRLTFPADDSSDVPRWYKRMTTACMAMDPSERPSFESLLRTLQAQLPQDDHIALGKQSSHSRPAMLSSTTVDVNNHGQLPGDEDDDGTDLALLSDNKRLRERLLK